MPLIVTDEEDELRMAKLGWKSNRHLTVSTRAGPSPAARAWLAYAGTAIYAPGYTFCIADVGCGLGNDVTFWNTVGYRAWGIDPWYLPGNVAGADLYSLLYVLNCIENPDEREELIQSIWPEAEDNVGLLVAVPSESAKIGKGLRVFNDGFLTENGSFEKRWMGSLFRRWVSDILDVQVVWELERNVLFVPSDLGRKLFDEKGQR